MACLLLLSFIGQVSAQDSMPPEECYGGAAVTSFGVYDPQIQEYVGIHVSCLPWWWEPAFMPFGWVFLSPAIVPVAFFEAGFVGSSFSFSSVTIVDEHFGRFRNHFHDMKGSLHGRFNEKFRHGQKEARKKFGNDLKHPPPGFKQAGAQHGQDGAKGKIGDRSGKSGPPAGKFGPSTNSKAAPSKVGPSPPKAGTAGKSGPPPPAKSMGKSGPPSPVMKKGPPPPAKSGSYGPGMGAGQVMRNTAPMSRAPVSRSAPAKSAPAKNQKQK